MIVNTRIHGTVKRGLNAMSWILSERAHRRWQFGQLDASWEQEFTARMPLKLL